MPTDPDAATGNRVRDLPPDDRPFTRCGYACRYTLPDTRPVRPVDADDPQLGITVTARSPGRHERFLATIPALAFRAMDDEQFMRTVAEMGHQVDHGGPISETDPCRQAHACGPQETCVLRKGHSWWHKSANGAEWKAQDGPTWTLPWPKDHPNHPANKMRCATEGTSGAAAPDVEGQRPTQLDGLPMRIEDAIPAERFVAARSGWYNVTGTLPYAAGDRRMVEFPKEFLPGTVEQLRARIGERVRINAPRPFIGTLDAVEEEIGADVVRLTISATETAG